MERSTKRKLGFAAIAFFMLVIAGSAYYLQNAADTADFERKPSLAPAATAPMPQSLRTPSTLTRLVQAASSAASAPQPLIVDICGTGAIDVRGGGEKLQALEALEAQRVQAHIAALKATGNERAKALAAWLSIAQAYEDAASGAEPNRVAGVPQGLSASGSAELAALANLARGTKDSYVYSVAMQACRHDPKLCSGLSWSRMAELDPDNGLTWLEIAAAAQREGNSALRDSAMTRATAAVRFDSHTQEHFRLNYAVRPVRPDAAAGSIGDGLLSNHIQGLLEGAFMHGYSQLHLLCLAPTRMPDSCLGVAQALVAKADNRLGLGIAASMLNKHSERSVDSIAAVDAHQALSLSLSTLMPDKSGRELSCPSLAHGEALGRAFASDTERSLLMQNLAQRNLSVSQAAAQYRAETTLRRERETADAKRLAQEAAKSPF